MNLSMHSVLRGRLPASCMLFSTPEIQVDDGKYQSDAVGPTL